MADMLGAADADEIKFGANMTSLTFHVSRSIAATMEPGDEIVVTILDHEANVGPWMAIAADRGLVVRTVDIRDDDCTLDLDDLDARPRTADEARRGRLGVERGRDDQPRRRDRPARPRRRRLDLRRRRPRRAPPADRRPGASSTDFLACSTYKFFGPHAGVLYGRRDDPRRAAGVQAPARRTTGSRPGPATSRASPG